MAHARIGTDIRTAHARTAMNGRCYQTAPDEIRLGLYERLTLQISSPVPPQPD